MRTKEEQNKIESLSESYTTVLSNYATYYKNGTHYINNMILKNTKLHSMLCSYFKNKYTLLEPNIQRLIREQIFRVLRGWHNNG